MSILNLFKKKEEAKDKKKETKSEAKTPTVELREKPIKSETPATKKGDKKVESRPTQTGSKEVKGKTAQAYRVIIKPLVTEKAADLGALGKYVFAIDPKMNKIEVKKAIRSIYKVDPVQVNILNFSGKYVRYGRVWGK